MLDKPTIDVYAPIKLEEATAVLSGGQWEDDPALKLVVQDTIRAENFEATKQWVMQWPTATSLYQSPFTARYWEGTQTERANIPMYTVATAVNSLVPQIVNGLFFENPPFMVQNRPGTSSDAARAIGALMAYQLEDINFREELRLGTINVSLYGTGIWKYGWESYTQKRTMFRAKVNPVELPNPLGGKPVQYHNDEDDTIEEIEVDEYIDRPFFEHIVNLRHVLVDPGLNIPNIQKAEYVIHRLYLTWDKLDKLREQPGYDIPSKKALLELFFSPKEPVESAPSETSVRNPLWDARAEARYEDTTVDPFQQPLEVLERWDNDKLIVVLQKKLVIYNGPNPMGKIPFLSCGWWDVPEAFWSMGLAKTIGSEQRLQQGLTNTAIDYATLILNGVYVRVRGKNIPTQPIRIAPGKIVEVDNKDDFSPLKRPDPVPEASMHLELSQSRAEQVSGASEFATQGVAGSSGHSNLARTAAGANLMAGGAGNRTSDFIDKLASQVIVPFLIAAHELNRALLPASTLRYIMSEELEEKYMEDNGDLIELLNARVKFSITAGAKMMARRNMAQALPIMIQFLTSEQTTSQLALQGLKVNVNEIMKMMFEVSDWRNYRDVIQKMTPEDQQRWQQTQVAAQQNSKAASQSKLAQQEFNNKTQLVDQENMARAGREVLRVALEKAATPEALTGEPGNTGFGSSA